MSAAAGSLRRRGGAEPFSGGPSPWTSLVRRTFRGGDSAGSLRGEFDGAPLRGCDVPEEDVCGFDFPGGDGRDCDAAAPGIKIAPPHFGHRAFLPAFSAPTAIVAWQAGHVA